MPASRIACLYLCPEAVVRSASPEAMQQALDALVEVAASFSPQVERGEDHVTLEVGDLARLYPSEPGLAAALQTRAEEQGLFPSVALAASAGTARLLARSCPGVQVVAPAEEKRRLAPLPLSALPLSRRQADLLRSWGLRTLGDMAALPRAQFAVRFGRESVGLHRLACGEDRTPLVPTPVPVDVVETVELEDPLCLLEPLYFLLRGALDRMVSRLAARSLACKEYRLHLRLSPTGEEERRFLLAAPTREVATLLELARVDLAARPPVAPVGQLSVRTRPAAPRPGQLSLLEPAGPRPEALATTLARLQVLCGEGRVGGPLVLDTFVPGEAGLVPPGAVAPRGPGEPPSPLPIAAHILRPARSAEVTLRDAVPVALEAPGIRGRIRQHAGPYRLRLAFQKEIHRDYYDVELEGGATYRLYQDRESGQWFVDARYE